MGLVLCWFRLLWSAHTRLLGFRDSPALSALRFSPCPVLARVHVYVRACMSACARACVRACDKRRTSKRRRLRGKGKARDWCEDEKKREKIEKRRGGERGRRGERPEAAPEAESVSRSIMLRSSVLMRAATRRCMPMQRVWRPKSLSPPTCRCKSMNSPFCARVWGLVLRA